MRPGYRNQMEAVVEKALREFVRNDRSLCSCRRCFEDMTALALNQLPPYYVTTEAGEAWLRSREETIGFVSDVIRAVKASSVQVRSDPRHDRADLQTSRTTPPPQPAPPTGPKKATTRKGIGSKRRSNPPSRR